LKQSQGLATTGDKDDRERRKPKGHWAFGLSVQSPRGITVEGAQARPKSPFQPLRGARTPGPRRDAGVLDAPVDQPMGVPFTQHVGPVLKRVPNDRWVKAVWP
jgi:hypothetical protein